MQSGQTVEAPGSTPGTSSSTGPKTYPTHATAVPRVLAVYCVDPRFQEPTEQFLAQELGFTKADYTPLVVGGGVASLPVLTLPKEAKYVRDMIQFYLEHFGLINRVVLINHEDCGKYAALDKLMPFLQHMTERQKTDLTKAAEIVMSVSPRKVSVETYYAKFANPEHTAVTFEKMWAS